MIKPKILIVDDNKEFIGDLTLLLQNDFSCEGALSGEDALSLLQRRNFDAILLDIDLGEGRMDGFQFLKQVHQQLPWLPVVMVSKYETIDTVVKAMKMGASNYVGKKPDLAELKVALQKAMDELRLKRNHQLLIEEIDELKGQLIGESEDLKVIRGKIDKLSRVDSTVLITGETGTGKELVAREIHRNSQRKGRVFIAVNCAAIPKELFESELFGHEKGSFTGAIKRQLGKFELANQGTIFLDEITELDSSIQAKLLRVLQEKAIERVGGSELIPINVRVMAATNRNLADLVQKGQFRDDLYYRLKVTKVHLPPLRERKGDIPLLAKYFAVKKATKLKRPILEISKEAMDLLISYHWPGNIRELENSIENAIVYTEGEILEAHLFSEILPTNYESFSSYETAKKAALEKFQKDYVTAILKAEGGNITKAASRMGISRQGLQKMMKNLPSRDLTIQ